MFKKIIPFDDRFLQLIIKVTLLTFLMLSGDLLYSQNRALYLQAPRSTSRYVRIGDLDIAGSQLTIEALINNEADNAGYDVVSKHTAPWSDNYLFRPGQASISTDAAAPYQFKVIGNPVPFALNTWYHIAMTYDGSFIRYYVNGCLVNQVAQTGNMIQTNLPTTIGNAAGFTGFNEQFIGYIDEVRIWNVVRTQAQIAANMNNLPNPTIQPGLIAYYKFEGNYVNVQGNFSWNGVPNNGATTVIENSPLPEVLTLDSVTHVDALCNPNSPGAAGSTTGAISIYAHGGIPPLTYSIDGVNFQASNSFTGVAPGTYTATAKNAYGNCTVTQTVTVDTPAVLNVDLAKADVSCNGGSDGLLWSTAAGGTQPYSYSWNTVPAQTTTSIKGVAIGTYTCTVTDDNGCVISNNIQVDEPTQLSVSITGSTNVLCKGDSTGSATSAASGGTPPYTYNWDSKAGSSTDSIVDSLPAGTYTVTVTDASCSPSGTELVTNGDFSAGNTGFTSNYNYCDTARCLLTDGEGFYAIGSSGKYYHPLFEGADHTTGSGDFMLVNGARQLNVDVWCQTITNIKPNTDYLFSTWVVALFPKAPSKLQFSINGVPIGNIFSSPAKVKVWENFFTKWNSGSDTVATICILNQDTTASGNDFGLDDISFQECTPVCKATATVTITEPDSSLDVKIIGVDVLCYGDSTGAATVNINGGTAPYDILWSTGDSVTAISGLPVDTYFVTVTDSNGCLVDSSASVIISSPDSLIANISSSSDVGCKGDSSGSATVQVVGGASPYSYLWSNGQTGSTATGLHADTFSVMVADKNNCAIAAPVGIVIKEPADSLRADSSWSVDITCNGLTDGQAGVSISGGTFPYKYNWSTGDSTTTITGLSSGTYSLVVADSNGCTIGTPLVFSISEPQKLMLASNSIKHTSCSASTNGEIAIGASGGTPGYSYSWNPPVSTTNVAKGVNEGAYNIVVTDSNGCQENISVTINDLNNFNINLTGGNTSCIDSSNGWATAIVTTGSGNYSYLWSNEHTGDTASGLKSGFYSVTVRDDSSGCIASDSIYIGITDSIVAAFDANPKSGIEPLVVKFTDKSIGQGITYQWDFGDNSGSTLVSPDHKYVDDGDYRVILEINSPAGCLDTASIMIRVLPESELEIPNVFTPDGDGVNDIFFPLNDAIIEFHGEIYNRWGIKIYEWDISNSGWDGRTQSGSEASEGTYYYIVKAKGADGQEYEESGSFTLIR